MRDAVSLTAPKSSPKAPAPAITGFTRSTAILASFGRLSSLSHGSSRLRGSFSTAKQPLLSKRLGAGVDHLVSGFMACRRRRDQVPSHEGKGADRPRRILLDDRHVLAGRDVVTGRLVHVFAGIENFGEDFFLPAGVRLPL
jgi:hypothetical protein